ncbi:MAG: hypothetical protein IPG72_00065 [Ardenticatenales bacterium]|nr:hypothetical protein [Ardenticatenales bacterium]
MNALGGDSVFLGEAAGACVVTERDVAFAIAASANKKTICRETVTLPRLRADTQQYFALAVSNPNTGNCGQKRQDLKTSPVVVSFEDNELRQVKTVWQAASNEDSANPVLFSPESISMPAPGVVFVQDQSSQFRFFDTDGKQLATAAKDTQVGDFSTDFEFFSVILGVGTETLGEVYGYYLKITRQGQGQPKVDGGIGRFKTVEKRGREGTERIIESVWTDQLASSFQQIEVPAISFNPVSGELLVVRSDLTPQTRTYDVRIVRYAPDGRQIKPEWDLPDDGKGNPYTDMEVGPDGRVYVLDDLADIVRVYAADGTSLLNVPVAFDARSVSGGPGGATRPVTDPRIRWGPCSSCASPVTSSATRTTAPSPPASTPARWLLRPDDADRPHGRQRRPGLRGRRPVQPDQRLRAVRRSRRTGRARGPHVHVPRPYSGRSAVYAARRLDHRHLHPRRALRHRRRAGRHRRRRAVPLRAAARGGSVRDDDHRAQAVGRTPRLQPPPDRPRQLLQHDGPRPAADRRSKRLHARRRGHPTLHAGRADHSTAAQGRHGRGSRTVRHQRLAPQGDGPGPRRVLQRRQRVLPWPVRRDPAGRGHGRPDPAIRGDDHRDHELRRVRPGQLGRGRHERHVRRPPPDGPLRRPGSPGHRLHAHQRRPGDDGRRARQPLGRRIVAGAEHDVVARLARRAVPVLGPPQAAGRRHVARHGRHVRRVRRWLGPAAARTVPSLSVEVVGPPATATSPATSTPPPAASPTSTRDARDRARLPAVRGSIPCAGRRRRDRTSCSSSTSRTRWPTAGWRRP